MRHLTGVSNPLAPSGAAERAHLGTGGPGAQCVSAISRSLPATLSQPGSAATRFGGFVISDDRTPETTR